MYNQAFFNLDQVNGEASRSRKAADLFLAAARQAKLDRIKSAIARRSMKLSSLQDLHQGYQVEGGYHAGVRPVPINKIVGSEGRSEDFDALFRPLGNHNRHRWQRVAEARQKGISLPPVELIQVGDVYYVRDGHHRISVARMLGQEHIDAEVQVLKVAPI
jgi:hypothetical protein